MLWANKSTLIQGIARRLSIFYVSETTAVNDNAPHFSLDEEPWSTQPNKTTFRPKNNDFVREIIWRAKEFKLEPLSRPSNWNRVQTIGCIEQNPITCDDDVRFSTSVVLRVREASLTRKQQEELQKRQQHVDGGSVITTRGGHWRGSVPYLQIFLCLTQDAVKRLFLTTPHARSQAELDARNYDTRYVSLVCFLSLLFHVPCS